jgi:hypothetical protein
LQRHALENFMAKTKPHSRKDPPEKNALKERPKKRAVATPESPPKQRPPNPKPNW